MSDPEQNVRAVRSFCDAWSHRDAAEIAACFTDDAVYHNMPMHPVRGRAAITAFIEQFLAESSEVRFELRAIATARGGIVMTERLDCFKTGERQIELPVAGVFELRDGKISAWRDYFDLQTWLKQARG